MLQQRDAQMLFEALYLMRNRADGLTGLHSRRLHRPAMCERAKRVEPFKRGVLIRHICE